MSSVNTQSSLPLEALSSLPIKDSNLYPLENGDDDAMSDDSFHLHLSEDEEEEKTEKKDEEAKTDSLPPKSEDDILNQEIDKFDGTEEPLAAITELEQEDEDKLLNESIELISKEVNADDDEKDAENTEKTAIDENTDSKTTDKNDSVSDNVNDSANVDSELPSEDDVKKEGKAEEVESSETDADMKEQSELLNNQILDPEDLLQMVDKETDENDKESSGANSPGSVDKGDGDEMLEGEETEKMDTEDSVAEDSVAETEKVDEEEDGVDIEESTPFKPENDAELDKVYKSLAAGDASDEHKEPIGSADSNKDNSKASDSEISANKESEIETNIEKIDEENAEMKVDGIGADTSTDTGADTGVDKLSTMEIEESEKEKEDSVSEKGKDSNTNDTSSRSSKRSLSESESETTSKKMKLQSEKNAESDNLEDSEKDKPKESETELEPLPQRKIIALNAIDEYLKIKSLKKLTFRDLEQIILQKICEGLCHKSEIGELRHQLGVQEQMVEMWRKEVAQLTKQARDLEIVNKRLLHEVRLKNERDKPLIPVKITRSVGLQVRSDTNIMNNVTTPRRRNARPQITNTQSTIAPAKQNRFNNMANRTNNMNRVTTTTANKVTTTTANKVTTTTANKVTTTMANKVTTMANKVSTPNKVTTTTSRIATTSKLTPVSKVVATSPAKKINSPKTPNSLLSKALQNSAAATTSNSSTTTSTVTSITTPTLTASTTPTTTASTTTANKTATTVVAKSQGKSSAESKVIDLTDEDDKKSSNPTQGVRIVSTPVKTVVTTAGVVNPPRIMYVYNNQLHQGVLSTDPSKPGPQKLMLKLNSNVIGQANGVLTAVSNGSAIAVSNAAIRGGQVQPVRLAGPITPVRNNVKSVLKHPAPLPLPPSNQSHLPSRKPVPPKPHLSIKRSQGGLVLSWKMPYNLENFEAIASYQLYAYQETSAPPSSDMWRKVGDVKALALPMACTLTQFADGNKYHFAVRAVDVQKRMGPFSDPEQILL